MSSTILERTRYLLEDIERYEKAIETELNGIPRTQRSKAQQQHDIDKYLDAIQRDAGEALSLYADKEARMAEIDAMSKGDIFKSFYAQLEEIQKYHKKFPDLVERPATVEPVNLEEIFSGEEYYGRFVDLHEVYKKYVNLPNVSRVDYVTYMSSFYSFKDISIETKKSPAYSEYLSALLDYLTSFYNRSQPLFDVEGLIEDIREEFAKKWDNGEIDIWSAKASIQAELEEVKKKAMEAAETRQKTRVTDINDIDDDEDNAVNDNPEEGEEAIPDFSSVESIEKLGLDKLKELLQKCGAKCGGSLRQRAERLFTILNSKTNEVPLELLKGQKKRRSKTKVVLQPQPAPKPAPEPAPAPKRRGRPPKRKPVETPPPAPEPVLVPMTVKVPPKPSPSLEILRPTAEREFVIASLYHELRDVINTTLTFIEKKMIQSYEERVKDDREMVAAMAEATTASGNGNGRREAGEGEGEGEDSDSSDDDEKPIYNPLNLPLGYDGKPIPYWLYKLHGLDEEFKCEICGNFSYWGKRAFDNHFQEWRHHNGMRCLGIPNTKHFHDITRIEDAKKLYAKIKDELKREDWSVDEEEFEDADGNVLSKKMYNDLVRQGLI